ncbi:MAG: N-acetylglucosamine-6-phosphate deacetylase [Xanthobacteraceae bacterium]
MSEKVHAVAARRIFDGVALREDSAVVIDGGEIAAVGPRAELSNAIPILDLPANAWLAPGFIDIQVNGGGDVLFNDEPTPEAIRSIAAAHRKFGTTSLLPTLISDSPEKMAAACKAVESLVGVEPSILGIHLEGPFLSPEKPGVHDPRALRQPRPDDLALLIAKRKGAMLVTLAPERVPLEFIAALAASGVRVSLGHSMATYAQTKAAMAAGLTGFTHLFNAMRPLDSREPGPIAAALESEHAWYGVIVDGVHVAPAMVGLALRGRATPILVTDAMPPVGGTHSSFRLAGETIFVRGDRCVRSDGRLAGAYLTMAGAVGNCVRLLGVPLTDALRFASAHPADMLGIGTRLGKLAAGFRADMVAFDGTTIEVLDTWVAGSHQP